MRKSRFSEEQKAKMVRETERSSVAEVAKKHCVSVETLYRWRRAYGGMELPEVKRLKQLEQENARLSSARAPPSCVGRRVHAVSGARRNVELARVGGVATAAALVPPWAALPRCVEQEGEHRSHAHG